MTLEDLVPPLEDCKRIPAGEFGNSVMAWVDYGLGPMSEMRSVTESLLQYSAIMAAAPTLKEIMTQLPPGTLVFMDSPDVWVAVSGKGDDGTKLEKAETPEAAALRLWLKIKGVECE